MVYFLDVLPELELFVDFKTSGKRRLISVNSCFFSLGKEVSFGMPSFHCFTGADSTSSFFKLSKKEWYSHWMNFPLQDTLNESFRKLSRCPTEKDVIDSQETIQKSVAYVYSKMLMLMSTLLSCVSTCSKSIVRTN